MSAIPAWIPESTAKRLALFDGEDDWLKSREEKHAAGAVGSTSAAALLGLSEWSTPWDVWARVHAPELLPADDKSPAFERILARGLALEPLTERLYVEATGAQSWGISQYMTATHGQGVISTSPDAFAMDGEGFGVVEAKVVMPMHRRKYPPHDMEIHSLTDLDDATERGRWPIRRQYVVQCLVHLIATGAEWCDLWCVFAEDVRVGLPVDGWDTDVAVHSMVRVRFYRSPEMLNTVGAAIMDAWGRIIRDGEEPTEGKPDIWGDRSDPLSGKREATADEVDILGALSQVKAVKAAEKADRGALRDSIEATGNAGIYAETDDGDRITATISRTGRLTVRGI